MKVKKIIALAIVAVMCVCALASCGAKTLDGTYTCKFTKDDITSNTFHNGFVTALGANEVNTIAFSPDGTYTYVKELHTEDESGNVVAPADGGMALLITYTFTGTYSVNGENAVLDFPTKVEWNENWGPLGGSYFINNSGTSTGVGGSKVQCKEDEGHEPFDIFVNPYVQDYLTTSESGFSADNTKVTVTVGSDNTFTYVIANSDDD